MDGVIIHNPGLFGSLSRGMPSLRPPTTLASRLSAAGGPVPAAPKTREGFPVSGASESPSHGITWTLPLAPSPSPGAPRGAAPEPAALCLPSPWQVLAALAALPKEPANPLDWLCVGKVGQGQLLRGYRQGGMWAELCGRKSWIFMLWESWGPGGHVAPWSSGVQQQQATVQLEASGNTGHSCREPPLICVVRGLGLGEHCKLGGSPKTGVWNRLTGNPRGTWGCWMPCEPFCAALRKCNGELLIACLCFAWGRGIKSSLMEQTKM